MALPEIEALDNLIETQRSLTDPAERDRALADIENGISQLLSNIGTYRGDAQVQLRASERNGSQG